MSLTTTSLPAATCPCCHTVSSNLFEIISGPQYKFQSWFWLLDFGALAIANRHGCSFCRYIYNLIIKAWLDEVNYDHQILKKSGTLNRIATVAALGIPRNPGAPRCQDAPWRRGQSKRPSCAICSVEVERREGALYCGTCLGYVPWPPGHAGSEHYCAKCLRLVVRYAMDAALQDDEHHAPRVALNVFINSEHQPANVLQLRFKYSPRKDEGERHMLWVEALSTFSASLALALLTVDRSHADGSSKSS